MLNFFPFSHKYRETTQFLSLSSPFCLCICLSVSLSISLKVCLPVCLPVYVSVCLSVCLSVRLSDDCPLRDEQVNGFIRLFKNVSQHKGSQRIRNNEQFKIMIHPAARWAAPGAPNRLHSIINSTEFCKKIGKKIEK